MRIIKKIIEKILKLLTQPFISFIHKYFIYKCPYIHGDKKRLHIGKRVSLLNTVLNLSSGEIHIGDDTIFGHNCCLVTGVHEFKGGMRKKLYHRLHYKEEVTEAIPNGNDIKIGKGCWITTNVTVVGGVTIGDNCIICAGAVVTKNIPPNSVVAGVPAKVINDTKNI